MSIFSNHQGQELRNLMNQMLAELTGDPHAKVENVDTQTDEDVNLIVYGRANGQQMSRMLSKAWLTETLIAIIQRQNMKEAA